MHAVRLQPGTRLDRYVVEGVLGQGGMARVYVVRHAHVGSMHALKVLERTDPVVQERLLQEGRIQGQLRDPRVVHVTDIIDVHGAPGLVMELVDGPSLAVLLRSRSLDLELADHIARELLGVMARAHQQGLIHRDLKPANVLLSPSPTGLTPKVADFGLAKFIHGGPLALEATATGVMLGTPRYMAPEQLRDSAHVDARADVFALGAILWEMVAGAPAFDAHDLPSLITQIDQCDSLDLDPSLPGAPDRMRRAIRGALRQAREDRWVDAGALLDAWVAGTPAPRVPWTDDDAREIRSLATISMETDLGMQSDGSPWVRTGPTAGSAEPTVDPSWQSGHTSTPEPAAPSVEVAARPRRSGWLWAGAAVVALAIGGAGAATWWALSPPEVAQEVAVERVSVVSVDPVVQARFERSWVLLHRGENARAYALVQQVAEAEPANAWVWFTASMAAPDEQSSEHLDVAAALATGPSAEERLIRMCSQAALGVAVESDWDTLEAEVDLPFLPIARALFTPGSVNAYDFDEHRARWERARDAVPESVLPWSRLAWIEIMAGNPAEGDALLRRAQERFPASPLLLKGRVDVAVAMADFAQAERFAREAVALDPSDRDARENLAVALLYGGNLAASAAEWDILLGTGTAVERNSSAQRRARAALGVGRIGEMEAALDVCKAAGVDADNATARVHCNLESFGLHFLLDDVEAMTVDAEALIALGSDPTVPAAERAKLQQRMLLNRGIVAARRGDLDQARSDRDRLSRLSSNASGVDVKGTLLFLDRAIREATGGVDRDFADTQTGLPSAGAVCQGARHLDRVGLTDEALGHYRRIATRKLAQSHAGMGRFATAYAALRVAELTRDSDRDEALAAVGTFYEAWSHADPDHSLVLRVEGVRSGVGASGE